MEKLKMKIPLIVCKVEGCNNTNICRNGICVDHSKQINEMKKCKTRNCPFNNNELNDRCITCSNEINKFLKNTSDKIFNLQNYVDNFNKKYNHNYNNSIYLGG